MTEKTKILVVDDDAVVQRLLRRVLESEGYIVFTAGGGETALEIIGNNAIDLAIVDIRMPGIDGYTLCGRIREFSMLPIILVTANSSIEEKVKGFECGADDYITKPFSPRELVMRIGAVLRRSSAAKTSPEMPVFSVDKLEIDFVKRSVTLEGKPVELTPTEYNLLKELVINRGKVLTHNDLLNRVWGDEYQDESQYVHVFISRLRKKLGQSPQAAECINTVTGVGYVFNV